MAALCVLVFKTRSRPMECWSHKHSQLLGLSEVIQEFSLFHGEGLVAAIAAFHPKIDGYSAYTLPRLTALLRDVQNAERVRSGRSASWGLSLVLGALGDGCYVPLEAAELSAVSHKWDILLA